MDKGVKAKKRKIDKSTTPSNFYIMSGRWMVLQPLTASDHTKKVGYGYNIKKDGIEEMG